MIKTQKEGILTEMLTESPDNVWDRFDVLDDRTRIAIFQTDYEIGICKVDDYSTDVKKIRTQTSRDSTPELIANMSKGQFHKYRMLSSLVAPDTKKGRPIKYYNI